MSVGGSVGENRGEGKIVGEKGEAYGADDDFDEFLAVAEVEEGGDGGCECGG